MKLTCGLIVVAILMVSCVHTDGLAQVEVTTSGGTIVVMTGLDTPKKLGKKINTKDLIRIVERRNRKMKGKPEESFNHEPTRGEYKVMLAANLLGKVQEPEGFSTVLILAEDPYYLMRGWAYTSLKAYGDQRALPTLLDHLKENKPCNGMLVPTLGELGDIDTAEELIELSRPGDRREITKWLEAIEKITGLSLAEEKKEWGAVYSGKMHEEYRAHMKKWWEDNKERVQTKELPNQRLEPIVTTPADEVEPQSTQGHLKRSV